MTAIIQQPEISVEREVQDQPILPPIEHSVALDVDGVLANFYLGMCRKFNKPFEMVDKWNVDWIWEHFRQIRYDQSFWEGLPVLSPPEAITFDFDYYVTALPKQMKSARERWLAKNGYPDKPVIISRDKLSTCKELGVSLLVDDKPETLLKLVGSEVKPIRFLPGYFETPDVSPFPIVKHLDQVNLYL